MYIIKSVDIKSFARIYALLMTLTCLIPWLITIIIVLFTFFRMRMMMDVYGSSSPFNDFLLPMLGWLIVPLIVYVVSLLLGLLFGWLYNIMAERFGGLKVNIVLEQPEPTTNQ